MFGSNEVLWKQRIEGDGFVIDSWQSLKLAFASQSSSVTVPMTGLLDHAPIHHRYLSAEAGFGLLSLPAVRTSMDSPQRTERRDIRYPLHLAVSVKLSHKEMHARSENISLGGILLSSAFLIPEGSTVKLMVTVEVLPDSGIQLSARGKVLRVQPKASGNFAVAIALDRPFELVNL
jgi:hypothetical protein